MENKLSLFAASPLICSKTRLQTGHLVRDVASREADWCFPTFFSCLCFGICELVALSLEIFCYSPGFSFDSLCVVDI